MNTLKTIIPALIAGSIMLVSTAASQAYVETTTVKTTTTSVPDPVVLRAGVSYFVIDPVTGMRKGVYDPITKSVNFTLAPGLVVIDSLNNRAVATFDSGGNLISLSSAPAFDPLMVAIETRRADFDRVIREIKFSGNLDDARLASLRESLDRINAMEVAYRAGERPLTLSEEIALASQINDLGVRLAPFVVSTNYTYTPLLGATFVASDHAIVVMDPLGSRNLFMQKRIDAEYDAGRLSNDQVARLKQKLNEASSLQAKYTKDGRIKDSKQRLISEKLDRVQTDMDKDVAYINERRARIGIKVN